jgi:flagellar biosynthesis regulator FlaF
MSLISSLVDILLGNQSLSPAEKAKREAAKQEKLAKRQAEALGRAASGQSAKVAAARAAKITAARAKAPKAPVTSPGGSVAAGSEMVPYADALTVMMPNGRVARYGWQPLRPAELSPLYGVLDSETLEKVLAKSSADDIEDPAGRLLDHISPSYAHEDLAYYQLDERYYTTLPIKRFSRDSFLPSTWREVAIKGQAGVESTLSIHFWRTTIAVAERGLRDQIAKQRLKLEELRASPGEHATAILDVERELGILSAQLKRVIAREETLFRVSAYLRVGARSLPELHQAVKNLQMIARTKEMVFDAALGKQRDAYVSSMPFSSDPADFTHAKVATEAAQLFPFLTRKHQERDREGRPAGILYGVHQYNRTPVMISPWNTNDTVEITTVLGRTGSGKSYWLRCHLGRLAMVGVQIIAIDPINDFGLWFSRNEGVIIDISPGSHWHVNPLKVAQEQRINSLGETEMADENIDVKINQRLKPLFQLLLGSEYSGMADGLIGHGLRAYYDRYGSEEHLMVDFVDVLRELNTRNEEQLSAGSIDERRRLIDNLKLKLVDGEFRSYFSEKTNVDLTSNKICFDLSRSKGGLQQAFACYLAVTMAVNLASQSHNRKIILVDEIHRLFSASESAEGIATTLEDLFRTHRHWNTAITFATQFMRDNKLNVAQEALLTSTTTWVLMRATEPMLKRAQMLVGENADLELILGLLITKGSEEQGGDKSDRPAIIYRENEVVPIWSVGLPFEDDEDDKRSSTRVATEE